MLKSWLRKQISGKFPKVEFDILVPPDGKLGDYSTNLAFILAKKKKKDPLKIGEDLVKEFLKDEALAKVFKKIEFIKPGFINFHFSEDFLRKSLKEIIEKGDKFGGSDIGKGVKVNLEFVSANPTGPLTVGNARSASFGDALANVLKKSGYDVAREYYINDAGNQVRILGESVARRYLRLEGKTIDFPENMYQGDYIVDIARDIQDLGIVKNVENFDELVEICREYAVKKLSQSIKDSLSNAGVNFDIWFSEKSLYDKGEVRAALDLLSKGKHVYEKDGAKWLKIDDSGEKDAVIVKSDGSFSYLMGDIAYTRNKFIRGFDRAINIWGTDHHGDVPRLKAGALALGYKEGKLEIILHQLVLIKKKDELQRMSKRKGEFVLLDDLIKEVGKDAVRFFFIMKDLNTHMEFDVDLAKEQSKNNPVYYIQYAYARLHHIFKKVKSRDDVKSKNPKLIKEEEELKLLRDMVAFPDIIDSVAENYNVHQLAGYTLSLATDFHKFYEKHRVVQDDNKELELERLELCRGVQAVLKLCLDLMGISTPEKM